MKGISINTFKACLVVGITFFIAVCCGRSAYGEVVFMNMAIPTTFRFYSVQKIAVPTVCPINNTCFSKLNCSGENNV